MRLLATLLVTLFLASPALRAQEIDHSAPDYRERTWWAPTAADWKKPCLIRWQRTWDDAVALAKQTGKPILVAINMDGEIASEHYAGVRYRDPEIAALYEPYVCVIASVYRHNPRDYDEQGRRIECPRFGSVTCGEHIAIEPILFEKFMDGKRIAPRHIGVELQPDGSLKEMYDVMLVWDTQSVFDAVKSGWEDRPAPPPVVKGDRSLVEKVASVDSADREAVEQAYVEGDAAQRRALVDAALSQGEKAPVELLRLAVFGLDDDLAKKARAGLAQSTSPEAVDVIDEALRAPLPADEREKLVSALDRLGAQSPKARTLAVVHQGLSARSAAVDVAAWTSAITAGATYHAAGEASGLGGSGKAEPVAGEASGLGGSGKAVPVAGDASGLGGGGKAEPVAGEASGLGGGGKSEPVAGEASGLGGSGYAAQGVGDASRAATDATASRGASTSTADASGLRPEVVAVLERQDEILDGTDVDAHLDLSEAFLQSAYASWTSDPKYARYLFMDARNTAQRAEELGADGWRVDAALAIADWYLGDHGRAKDHADAAVMSGQPQEQQGWNAMAVLAIFAQQRQTAIESAMREKRPWPPQWLADVNAACSVLLRHPYGTLDQALAYHDFLAWLGATGQADSVLDEALARWTGATGLHDRLRARVLREHGARGLEPAYDALVGRLGDSPVLQRFAAEASRVRAEFGRRRGEPDEALAAYARALAHAERALSDADVHDAAAREAALDHAGRARIALEQGDDATALDELVASFGADPWSAATQDGLNITAVDTAKMLLARLRADTSGSEEVAPRLARLERAMDDLDPSLLELPAYERVESDEGR
ncbi:MAG: hypothetical protein H6825_10100 [Planctomycetes bacterium]|nr:hypothetical protein [Planctomycetota bacterium]